MVWVLSALALACILGVVGLVLIGLRHSVDDDDYDLGSVSQQWMNQHRTNS